MGQSQVSGGLVVGQSQVSGGLLTCCLVCLHPRWKTIFVPINHPVDKHWLCVTLKLHSMEFGGVDVIHMRVYNSHKDFRTKHHELVVRVMSQLTTLLGQFKCPRFVDLTPETQLDQRASHNWCSVHVLARAWQLATNQLDCKVTIHNIEDVYNWAVRVVLAKHPSIVANYDEWESLNNYPNK